MFTQETDDIHYRLYIAKISGKGDTSFQNFDKREFSRLVWTELEQILKSSNLHPKLKEILDNEQVVAKIENYIDKHGKHK